MKSLPAGKSMEFVYIHSAAPANVLVSNYSLEWVESASENPGLLACKLVHLILKIFGLVIPRLFRSLRGWEKTNSLVCTQWDLRLGN